MGNYGKLPAPIDAELLAKVAGDKKITDCRPADLLEPEWEGVCKELGDKYTSEEDRLTYALFQKVALKFFETRGQPLPASKPAAAKAAPANTPASPASAAPQGGSSIYQVRVNGKDFTVEVAMGGSGTMAPAPVASAPAAAPAPASSGGGSPLTAPLPGSIFALKCNVGDSVNEGDTVLVMESMKMESEVKAHQSGTIQSILVKEGDNVQTGDQLVTIG
jgi:oxaloacetate decarboxylase alpha subunit